MAAIETIETDGLGAELYERVRARIAELAPQVRSTMASYRPATNSAPITCSSFGSRIPVTVFYYRRKGLSPFLHFHRVSRIGRRERLGDPVDLV